MEPLRVRLLLREPGQALPEMPDALIVPARIIRKPAVAGTESRDV